MVTMMANSPFLCSVMEMPAFWWGGGARPSLIRTIIAWCAVKYSIFLDSYLIFPVASGNLCRSLTKGK